MRKSRSYLMKKGFKNVFQLNGGIISYLKKQKIKIKSGKGNVLFLMKELQLEIIYQKVIMINVLHVGLLLQKRIKVQLITKKVFIVPNVNIKPRKNKKKVLKKELDKSQ